MSTTTEIIQSSSDDDCTCGLDTHSIALDAGHQTIVNSCRWFTDRSTSPVAFFHEYSTTAFKAMAMASAVNAEWIAGWLA